MPFDQHKNLAIAVVAVAPSPSDTGLTLTVAAGHGVRYPVPPFDVTIWLATKYPNPDDAEVARCTALAGDVLTLVRAQGGTTARLVQPGDLIAESITAQYLQSLEAAIGTTPAPPTLHAPTHAEGGTDPVQLTQSQITGLTTSLTTIEGDITTLEGNVTNLQTIVTSGPVALHAPRHAVGGADPVTVTALAGYPGGTANFLRADGTFAAPPGGGAGADEVFVGATDPGATYELWYDTAAVSPTNNYALTNAANTFTQSQTINGNLSLDGDLIFPAKPLAIRNVCTTSADGSDYDSLYIFPAGGPGPTRAASIELYGNDVMFTGGTLALKAGDGVEGKIGFWAGGSTRGQMHRSGGFSWGSTTDPGAGNLSVAGHMLLTGGGTHNITHATNPGADTGETYLAGSGAVTSSRGAYIGICGNEAGFNPGTLTLIAGNIATAAIKFYSGPSLERGRIHASGGFSWGSSFDAGAGTMHLTQATPAGANLICVGAGSGQNFPITFNNGSGQVGYIGTLASTTTYGTTSDARLKTPLQRHFDPDILRRTVIHEFIWKSDGTTGRGVFAQEAYEVAPFAVSVGSDEVDDQGRLTKPWGVDYSKYVPDLITGWQAHDTALLELIADNVALAARMESLERLAATLVVPSYAKPLSLFQRVREAIAAWFPAWITPRKERRCLT